MKYILLFLSMIFSANVYAHGSSHEDETIPIVSTFASNANNVFVFEDNKWTHDKNGYLIVCSIYIKNEEHCIEWRFVWDYLRNRQIMGIQFVPYGYRNYGNKLVVYTKY